MNVSFDLDGTLIPSGEEFAIERRGFVAKLLGIEPIRKGTCNLILSLQRQGHSIHIYTTSFRSKLRIKLFLRYYGIKVDKIVNQKDNQKVLKSLNICSSKYPLAFGFDWHIDDAKGVEMEAKIFDFKVIIVKSNDEKWVDKLKSKIENNS